MRVRDRGYAKESSSLLQWKRSICHVGKATSWPSKRFLAREMPALEAWFHYRNLDVSTLKELARRWAPALAAGLQKSASHTALADIRESVQELTYYRQFMGELGGRS